MIKINNFEFNYLKKTLLTFLKYNFFAKKNYYSVEIIKMNNLEFNYLMKEKVYSHSDRIL